MDEELERKLIEKYPFTRAKQDPQELADDMEIMAKRMTKDDIDNVEQIEDAVGKKGLISDSIKKEKNKNKPEIYNKKIKPIWDLMVFGFEVDNGWYDLLDRTFGAIEEHVESHPNAEVILDQVKEKYGRLMIYYHGGDDHIDKIVTKAENDSEHTCEVCGAPGRICSTGFDVIHKDDGFYIKPSGGWYKALCRKDAKQLGYIYETKKITDKEAYEYLKKMKSTYEEDLANSSGLNEGYVDDVKKKLKRVTSLLDLLK